MQTNRDLLAQEFPEDILVPPQEQEEDAGPAFPEDILTPPGQVQPDPFPVQDPGQTPREWLSATLRNLLPSAVQNLNDMWQLVQPVGKRANEKWMFAPGILDLARLAAETQYKGVENTWNPVTTGLAFAGKAYTEFDENVLRGMEQAGWDTPMLDAAIDYFAGRYNFSDPAVRRAFSQVVQEDPFGVLTDVAGVASLGFGGAAAGAKGAASAAKAASAAGKAGRVARGMSKALGWTQRANRIVNQGFHIPLVPGKIVPRRMQSRVGPGGKGFEIKSGVADIVDPGMWGLRAVGNVGRRALSPYASKTSADKQAGLGRQGFGDEPPETTFQMGAEGFEVTTPDIGTDAPERFTLLSLMNTSDGLADIEARRFDKEYAPVVEAVKRTEDQLNRRVREIMETAHESGDLGEAAYAMAEAFRETQDRLFEEVNGNFERAGVEPGLVINMQPVYTYLRELEQQDRVAARLDLDAGAEYEPFASEPQLQNFNQIINDLADQNQNMLTSEFLEGAEPQTTTAVQAASGEPAARVEDQLYGTPTRQSYDADSGEEYATEYRVMELDDIITSHDLAGNPDSRYQSDLQVKDMSSEASQRKVLNIARKLRPDMVLTGRNIQQGSPILNQRKMSISGAHRLNALRLAQERFPDKYAAYREALKGEIAQYGIDVDVDAMTGPALVRVLVGDVDELALARKGNVSDVADLPPDAQALQDAHLITDDVLNLLQFGDEQSLAEALQASANADFRNSFLNKIATDEISQFEGSENPLSNRGVERLTNAIMTKLFSGNYGAAMRETFTKMKTRGFTRIRTGIINAMPALIQLRDRLADLGDLPDNYDLAEPMAEAVMKIRHLIDTAEGGSGVQKAINTYLGDEGSGVQQPLDLEVGESEAWRVRELDEKGRMLLRLLADGVRSGRKITGFIRDYADAVERLPTSTSQTSLLGDSAAIVPPEELVDTFVQKWLEGETELEGGLEDLLLSDEAATPDAEDVQPTVQARPKMADRPVLYENLVAYRKALVDAMSRRPGSSHLQQWRTNLVRALDGAVYMTIRQTNPSNAIGAEYALLQQLSMERLLNTSFAETLVSLTDAARNPGDPAVQRAMETLFATTDTPATINMKYHLLGGFNSEAGQRVRRVFLGRLFGFIRTPAGQVDAAAAARGVEPIGELSRRYREDGIAQFMNQFMVESADYSQETLRAILGKETVDNLNDLDIILQDFGRFMKRTGGSENFFFGEGRGRQTMMQQIATNFGRRLLGGGVMGAGGTVIGGIPGAIVGGVIGFLGEWLGTAAIQRTFNMFYGFPWGKRLLLNGIEAAMRDAWDAGARVLLREGGEPAGKVNLGDSPDADTRATTKTATTEPPSTSAQRTAVRTARTALKREDDED